MAGTSITAAINALDAITALIDVGAAAELRIYTGTAPAYTTDAATGTLLVAFTVGPFNAAIDDTPNALAVGNPAAPFPLTENGLADGTAGYFRITADPGGAGEADIVQGTCGVANADLLMNSTSISLGIPVILDSFDLIMPEEF